MFKFFLKLRLSENFENAKVIGIFEKFEIFLAVVFTDNTTLVLEELKKNSTCIMSPFSNTYGIFNNFSVSVSYLTTICL